MLLCVLYEKEVVEKEVVWLGVVVCFVCLQGVIYRYN